jgi:WD40 repeat protein
LDATTLRLLDKLPGQLEGTVRLAAPRSGPLLAVASGPWPNTEPGQIAVYDLSTRKRLWVHPLEPGFQTAVAIAPDGSEVAVGDEESLSLWNVADGRRRMYVSEVTGTANGLAYNVSGTRLACASNTGRLHIIDAASGRVRNSVVCDSNYVYGVAFSPSGLHVATGGSDGYVRLWDAETLAPAGAYRGHGDAVLAINFAPDGRRFASAGKDYRLNLWTQDIDEPLLTLKGHRGWVFQAVFAPDGHQLASSSYDGQLRVWNAGSATGGGEMMALSAR